MYQALYRKWRPRDFDSVVGQEHITRTLKNEVAAGKFSHAYLFTGSRGTGKTTCSKIVAKAVNCLHPKDGNPCNECDNCKGIDNGSILDVVEIDAASNNGVDNIRELREEALFMPAVAKYRVYILDECHMLSPGAVNALLKILEEPPEHVIFILATTEIHKVLPTILSRCQRFDFKRIRSHIIADRLLYVAQQEEKELSEDAAMLIARLSDGGMRDALSLLDLCISHGNAITVQSVTECVGLGSQEMLFSLADAINSCQPGKALEAIDALSENSIDFTRLCEQLIQHYRNLMLIKAAKSPEDFITAVPEDLERMKEQGKFISMNRILFILEQLQDTIGRLARTAFKRAELEMAAVRLSDENAMEGLSAVLERLEKLERQIRSGAIPSPAPVPSPVPKEENIPFPAVPVTPAKASSPQTQTVEPFNLWPQVLEELKKRNGALYGAMMESKAYTKGDMMLVECENELFRTLLRTSPTAKESLRDAIMAITGRKFNLGPYNPQKYKLAQAEKEAPAENPLDEMLKRAQELNVPVEIK